MDFQDIKYGWVALASVAIVGTTIYVANNERRQVHQVDVIEIALGAYERCLATVYPEDLELPATNRRYGVAPFNIVRDWVTSNGIVRVTNAIGWQVDRDMMITIDGIIKALVPHYANTNFACTSINTTVRLTVTGVWDALDIGDGTNQFTRTPELPDTTNYVVNYTSYWPSCATSEVVSETEVIYAGFYPPSRTYSEAWSVEPRGHDNHAWVTRSNWPYESFFINNSQYRRYFIDYTNHSASTSSFNIMCYTTAVDEAVNYAAYWEYPTGTFTWVTQSNWPAVVVSNAATYGDYPWQIYEQDLVERYKVLNYLRVLAYPINPDDFTPAQAWNGSTAGNGLNFGAGRSGYYDPPPSVSYETFAGWWDRATAYTYPTHDYPGSPKQESHVMGWNDGEYYLLELGGSSARSRYEITGLPTNGRPYNLIVEAIDYPIGGSYSLFGTNWVEIYAASNSLEPEHFTAYFGSLGLIDIPVPAAEQFPLTWTSTHTFDALGYNTGARLTCVIGEAPIDDSGKQYWSSNVFENFYYATNAYWE